jgi:hypothetical protein
MDFRKHELWSSLKRDLLGGNVKWGDKFLERRREIAIDGPDSSAAIDASFYFAVFSEGHYGTFIPFG